MNLTFIIGNGFDRGLGLPTSYQAFCKWYLQQQTSVPAVLRLKSLMSKTSDCWCDLEMALGMMRHDDFYGKGNELRGEYVSAFDDLRFMLMSYLERCQKQLRSVIPQDVRSRFMQSVLSIVTASCLDVRQIYKDRAIHLNFVNFNYTDTLTRFLVKDCAIHDMSFAVGDERKGVYFESEFQVHGTLRNHDIVLGVDNVSQINKEGCGGAVAEHLKEVLVKRDEEKSWDENSVVHRACQVLVRSNAIVLFGVSLGQTDRFWWRTIGRLLEKRTDVQVFYSPWCKPGGIAKQVNDICEAFELVQADEILASRRVQVLSCGPHPDFDGESHWCDPLHLSWLRKYCLIS